MRTTLTAGLLVAALLLGAEAADAAFTVKLEKRTLVITGSAAKDTLRLRGGAVKVAGTRVSRRRFDRVRVRARGGNDTIRTTGRVPVTFDGGRGRDRLVVTGSAAADTYRLGRNRLRAGRILTRLARIERVHLATGASADTLTVDDQSTTSVRALTANLGGADGAGDRALVNGSSRADAIDATDSSVTGLAARVALTGREASDSLTINALGGDDRISGAGLTTAFTADGGGGADSLRGGRAGDTLLGGAGADRFAWNAGDGNDVVDGQGDQDALIFTGSDRTENYGATADAGRVRLTRADETSPKEEAALDGVERVEIAMLGGVDELSVDDVSATDLTTIDAALGAGLTSDAVFVNGSEGADAITAMSGPSGVAVAVGSRTVAITGAGFPQDAVAVNALGGDDTVSSSGLAAGVVRFSADGGTGRDDLTGGDADERFVAGDGDDHVDPGRGADTPLHGAGEDVYDWQAGDGSDSVDGGADFDVVDGRGTPTEDRLAVSRAILGAAPDAQIEDGVNSDVSILRAVEDVRLDPAAGPDEMFVGDLSTTTVGFVAVNLGSDGGVDHVIAEGSAADETVTVSRVSVGTPGQARVDGLPGARALVIVGADPTVDELTIDGQGGNDRIDASTLPDDSIDFDLEGGGGDDVLLGGAGVDRLSGDQGHDRLDGGAGPDHLFGGEGDDDLVGGPGDDTLRGDEGDDNLLGGPGDDDLDGGPGTDVEID
jgi:Ca2+-binding RTX toxin-like protein